MEVGLETFVSPDDFEMICEGIPSESNDKRCVWDILSAFNDLLQLGIFDHNDFPRIVFNGVHNAIPSIFRHDQFW